ncbi:hypothetical protein [Aeromonas phage PZL-Ah152]|uniref:Uncharacterized protein n=3 Tax=Armandvirus TaxID=3424952 RepID=A0A7S6HS92_9CAUD|nr:hypothetical protein [Aeromonas phage T7-Ah]QTH79780.1 hypothetical protein [Aeromonas phage PZL-Ah152]
MKHVMMSIKHSTGATVCTPDGFAMRARCERLKREMRMNRKLNNI